MRVCRLSFGAQLGDRPYGLQLTAAQDRDPVGPGLKLGQNVRGQNDGRAACFLFIEDLEEITPGFRVETGHGFVQQQKIRIADQSLGKPKTLPHALGVGADPTVCGLAEMHAVENSLVQRCIGALQPGIEPKRLRSAQRVLEHGLFRQEPDPALDGVELRPRRSSAEDAESPATWRDEPEAKFEQRTLARTVRADQGDALARMNVESDPVQGFEFAVGLGEGIGGDGGSGAHDPGPSLAAPPVGGSIRGARSITPPGCSAGNELCAHFRT